MPAPPSLAVLVDPVLRLLDREARLAEQERALLERLAALPLERATPIAESMTAQVSELSARRERLVAERAEQLLGLSGALDRAERALRERSSPPEGVFWESLSERLGQALVHELPELGPAGVTEVIERTLNAVGVAVRSRPPSAAPPPSPPVTTSAVDEEAELLAGVGGPSAEHELEEPPSMGSFIRALDVALPPASNPAALHRRPHEPAVPAPVAATTPEPTPAPAHAPAALSEPTPPPDSLPPVVSEPVVAERPTPAPTAGWPAMDAEPSAAAAPPQVDLARDFPGLMDDLELGLDAVTTVARPGRIDPPRAPTPVPAPADPFAELAAEMDASDDDADAAADIEDTLHPHDPPPPALPAVGAMLVPETAIAAPTFPPDADESPVDEFASFAAMSAELHSAIEQSVDALTQSGPPPAFGAPPAARVPTPPPVPVPAPAPVFAPEFEPPPRPTAQSEASLPLPRVLSPVEQEIAMRMTEEVHLSDADIAGIFAHGAGGRSLEAFAFEMPAAPPPPTPPTSPAPAPKNAAPPPPSDDGDDPFAELASALDEGDLGPLPPKDGTDDPFADLAAELADFEPVAPSEDDELDLDLEPIPGYDLRMPSADVAPEPAPERMTSPPPVSPPPAEVARPAPTFRPTLGRVDRGRPPTAPIRPVQRPADRGAATFAALAAELDIEGVDPWRELDISDLRTSGHPGPLPTPPPVAPPRARTLADRSVRATLAVKVGVEYGTSFFTGFSGNISRTGVFVATHQAVPVGARVELFFEMPDGHAVAAPAQVRWVRDLEQAELDGSSPGLGMVFVNLSHDDAIVLERYVAAHAASALNDAQRG